MKHSRVLTAFNPYTIDPFIRFFAAPADAETPGPGSGDQTPDSGETPDPEPTEPKPGGDEELGEGGKKALHSEREARKQFERENAELKAQVKEFEDATKSAEEKQAERLQELEKTSTANALKVLQYEVAAEKGLPLPAATRLTGDSKEALEKDADDLKKLLAPSEPPAPPVPKPDPSQGNGTDKPKPKNLADAVNLHYS